MNIYSHRGGNVGMSQKFTEGFHIKSPGNAVCGKNVAEHMEVEVGNSQLFQDFLKTVLQRAGLQIFLFLSCKDISFSVSF